MFSCQLTVLTCLLSSLADFGTIDRETVLSISIHFRPECAISGTDRLYEVRRFYLHDMPKNNSLGKIRHFWNCSNFLPNLSIYIYSKYIFIVHNVSQWPNLSDYRGGFRPHILQNFIAIFSCIQKF